MNRTITILLATLFLLLTENTFSQVNSDPISYMNHISEQYDDIIKDTWQYTRSIAHSRNARKIEKKRFDLLSTMASARRTVAEMPAFNTDNELRDSVVAYLDLNYRVLDDDYGDITRLEEVSEESYENMKAYLEAQEKATEKLEKAGKAVDIQYNLFAEKYEFDIQKRDDKLTQKLDLSREVFAYYNQIYLVQFRANLMETLLLGDLTNCDIPRIQKHSEELKLIAEQGLLELQAIGYFKGNSSLNQSCVRLLNFYKEEAEQRIPFYTEFIQAQQEYNDLVSSLQAKKERDVTQADVNNYNKATADFKRKVTKFNSTQNLLNTKRESTMNAWSSTVDAFFDRYIPKR